jgi:hypothetical protein
LISLLLLEEVAEAEAIKVSPLQLLAPAVELAEFFKDQIIYLVVLSSQLPLVVVAESAANLALQVVVVILQFQEFRQYGLLLVVDVVL